MPTLEEKHLKTAKNSRGSMPQPTEIFFRKGVESRILFHYDARDQVDTLIERRNNEDVFWRKTK